MKNNLRKIFLYKSVYLFILLILTVLASCGNPISLEAVNMNKDVIPPEIIIDNPADESGYNSRVVVTGSVSDSLTLPEDRQGLVVKVSYSVLSTSIIDEEIIPNPDTGAFTFTIEDTTSYTGNIEIAVTAVDGNKNTATVILKLVDDDIGPYLEVTSPEALSFFESLVTVTGMVSDSADTPRSFGELDSLEYRIAGDTEGTMIVPGVDGRFSFTVNTAGITDDEAVIQITARDKNGDETLYQLRLLNDGTGPYLTIDMPAPNSYYGASIYFSGIISDTEGESSVREEVQSLRYEVLGSTQSAELILSGADAHVDVSGTYGFYINASLWSGVRTVMIMAEDFNGNETVESITLYDAGNDVPAFSAVPGDRQVTLSWDEIPAAETYTVYYTTDGTNPSEYYYHGTLTALSEDAVDGSFDLVLSTHDGDPLENGSMHSFMLKATGTIGEGETEETIDNFSDVVQAIPLGGMNLCPRVEGSAGGITVAWNPIEGTDMYTIYRRAEGAEPIELARNYSGTSFTDGYAQSETRYWYSVAPAMTGSVRSDENEGIMVPLESCPGISLITDTRNTVYSLAIKDNYAFVADDTDPDTYQGILSVYDISDTDSVTQVGGLTLTADDLGLTEGEDEYKGVHDVVIQGNTAILAVQEYGLVLVDIEFPENPSFLGACQVDTVTYPSYCANALAVEGNTVYMAGDSYIYYFDITNTAVPTFGGASSEYSSVWFSDLEINGNFIIAVSNGQIVRVLNKADLTAAVADGGSYDISPDTGVLAAKRVTSLGEMICFGLAKSDLFDGGLIFYDFDSVAGSFSADPVNISWQDDTDDEVIGLDSACSEVVFNGNICYAVYNDYQGTSGLAAWDLSDPAEPAFRLDREIPGDPGSVFVNDDYIVTGGSTGIKVFDYSGIVSPSSVSLLFLGGTSLTKVLERRGDYFYIIDMTQSQPDEYMMRVFREDTGGSIVLEQSYDLGSYSVYDMEVNGELLFTAIGNNGLKIYSLEDISTPVELVHYATPRGGTKIISRGIYAFLLENFSVQVIDIEDPSNPVTIDTLWVGNSQPDMELVGDFLYVISQNDYIVAKFDVSDPENISRLDDIDFAFDSSLDPRPDPKPIKLDYSDGYLYVALTDYYVSAPDDTMVTGQFAVVEISESGDDEIVSWCWGNNSTTSIDQRIEVQGDYLFACQDFGSGTELAIYSIAEKDNPYLMKRISGLDSLSYPRITGRYLDIIASGGPDRWDLLGE